MLHVCCVALVVFVVYVCLVWAVLLFVCCSAPAVGVCLFLLCKYVCCLFDVVNDVCRCAFVCLLCL